MALTLVDEPRDITLARNPAIIQLRSAQTAGGDLYSAVGVSASMSVLLADRFATGETFTVEFEEPSGTTETIVFEATGGYEADDEIPDDTFSGNNAEYWIAMAEKVNDHPRIAPFFTCEPVTVMGALTIKVTARGTDAGWTLTVTNDPGFTVTPAAAVADSTPDNYRVLLEVFFEKTYRAGDYSRVAQLEGFPDNDTGFVYFDISGIIAANCRATRTEPLVPVFGTNEPFVADNLRRYHVRYSEEYGAPAETQPWEYLVVKLAIDGGVSQATYNEAGYNGFLATLDAGNAFLSWMPNGRTLGLEQPEFLSWYNHTGDTKQVLVEVVRYDVDTGNAATTLFAYAGNGIDVRSMETLVIPVGIDELTGAIGGSPFASDHYKYVVRVVDESSDYEGGDPEYLSQPVTYYIDREYREASRYVQYVNGFGVPETWRCTGEWSKRLQVQRQVATKPILPGYNTLASDSFQYARTFDPVLTYRTGYLRKGEAEVLQEMLIAGDVYDVSAEGYIPLRITDTRFDVTSTFEDLHTYQFATQPRLSMRNFSKKATAAAVPDGWQEVNNDFWFDSLTVAWGGV